MKPFMFRYIPLIAICILLIGSIGVIGCKNSDSYLTFSNYKNVPEIPPEITIDQLYLDYITDPIAADDKYKGERFCFYEVEVEEVFDYGTSGKKFFVTNNVKFVLRSASKMQNVEPGFILNLVGECRGIENMPIVTREVIAVKDCWSEGVNCDLGEDEWFSPGY